MDWRLAVVVVPVSDVDRSKAFYADGVGFDVDHDIGGDGSRIVQLTPPGSGCSIVIGVGLPEMAPGSVKGLQLVVSDLRAAHAALADRGVPVGPVQVFDDGRWREASADDALDAVGFVFFDDPDGNGWAVQQVGT